MKYFKSQTGDVFGYDETYENDLPYIEAAIQAGWIDVTGSWPPVPVELPEVVVISSINPAQIRMQLSRMNLRQQVEDAVASGSQDLKDLWNYSPVFKIDDPNIQAMAVQLGIGLQDLEALFIEAAKL